MRALLANIRLGLQFTAYKTAVSITTVKRFIEQARVHINKPFLNMFP